MGFDYTIRIAGEAGQGIQTIGASFCRIFKDLGWNFIANQEYMSRVRGGNNYYQIRIGDHRPLSFRQSIDLLVPLNAESVGLHRKNRLTEGKIVVDKKLFHLTDDHPARMPGTRNVYTNWKMIGTITVLICYPRFKKAGEWGDRIPVGVIYRNEKPSFEERIGLDALKPLIEYEPEDVRFATIMESFG